MELFLKRCGCVAIACVALSGVAEDRPDDAPPGAELPTSGYRNFAIEQSEKRALAIAERSAATKAARDARNSLPINARIVNSETHKFEATTLSVTVGKSGEVYIGVSDDAASTAFITADNAEEMVALLRKSLKWSDASKLNQLDTTRDLGAFGSRISKTHFQGVGIRFFTGAKGRQCDVILTLIGYRKEFGMAEVYIDCENVKILADRLIDLPITFSKNEKKADAFLK